MRPWIVPWSLTKIPSTMVSSAAVSITSRSEPSRRQYPCSTEIILILLSTHNCYSSNVVCLRIDLKSLEFSWTLNCAHIFVFIEMYFWTLLSQRCLEFRNGFEIHVSVIWHIRISKFPNIDFFKYFVNSAYPYIKNWLCILTLSRNKSVFKLNKLCYILDKRCKAMCKVWSS